MLSAFEAFFGRFSKIGSFLASHSNRTNKLQAKPVKFPPFSSVRERFIGDVVQWVSIAGKIIRQKLLFVRYLTVLSTFCGFLVAKA